MPSLQPYQAGKVLVLTSMSVLRCYALATTAEFVADNDFREAKMASMGFSDRDGSQLQPTWEDEIKINWYW